MKRIPTIVPALVVSAVASVAFERIAQADSFTYDLAGRVTQSVRGSVTTTYAYDALGDLVRRCTNGTCTDLVTTPDSEPTVIAQVDVVSDRATLYAPGSSRTEAFRSAAGASFYVLSDAVGSPVGALDSGSGSVSAEAFDAFGERRTQGSAAEAGVGFTGENSSPDDPVLWLRARSYLPALGRFLQRDSYTGTSGSPESLQRYGYAYGNPVSNTDPSGMCPDCDYSSSLQNLSDLAAGVGDFASLGLTRAIRQRLGDDAVVQNCSWFYRGGGAWAAVATMWAIPFSGGPARFGPRAAPAALEAEAASGMRSRPAGEHGDEFRARTDWGKKKPSEGLGAHDNYDHGARGRPNEVDGTYHDSDASRDARLFAAERDVMSPSEMSRLHNQEWGPLSRNEQSVAHQTFSDLEAIRTHNGYSSYADTVNKLGSGEARIPAAVSQGSQAPSWPPRKMDGTRLWDGTPPPNRTRWR